MTKLRATIATLAVGVTISSTCPATAENVLRWASDVGALTFDPHSAKHGPSTIQRDQVYERLLHTSARLEVVPQLAVAWRPLDSTSWEFKLREGVRFHDGVPFTAEDVVFSIERARSEPSQFAGEFADITDVRAVDAHTVHITTSALDALLPDRLRLLFIMSKAWAGKHGVTRARFQGRRRDLCHGPRERHRSLHPRNVRARRTSGDAAQSGLVGLRVLPGQH